MQNEIEMLRSIRQSTEMGCSGIRAVLPGGAESRHAERAAEPMEGI